MTKPGKLLITGSSGLIGSEAVTYFASSGWSVVGIDNNLRASFFGLQGDTTWNLQRLKNSIPSFRHYDLDIRNRQAIQEIFRAERPAAVIHCAAQPSHDLAKDRPFDDFEINALGTLNLLEASRQSNPESPFIFMSTNKVYGDAPNSIPLKELEGRWEYARPENWNGVSEECRLDRSVHSLFGVSKAAGDLMVQEYGRYFGMPTVCFRGGCLTGPSHSGVELHGFLSWLVKTAVDNRPYRIFGYKGKQVRDQIHSCDVVRAMEAFLFAPKAGEVYNLGGGRESNASLWECVRMLESRLNRQIQTEYVEQNRLGDHICYISDIRKFEADYPAWRLTRRVPDILDEMIEAHLMRKRVGDARAATPN